MKKYLCLISVLFILIVLPVQVFANGEAIVSCNGTTLKNGDEAILPIEIDNNSGLMGFKLMLDYNPKELVISEVITGTLTSSGSFASNEGLRDGHIDIIWSSSKEVAGAGTLFKINVKAISSFDSSTINISYSQEDTFNEKWEDVALKCRNIEIAQNGEKPDSSETDSENSVSEQQIVEAVNLALEESGYNSLNEVKNRASFTEAVNEIISDKTGVKNYYTDYKSIKSDFTKKYKKVFTENIKDALSQKEINKAVDNALKTSKARTIDSVNNKEKFVELAEEELSDKYPDALNLNENLDSDEAYALIKDLYSGSYKNNAIVYRYIFAVAATLILVILCVLLVIKQRKNKFSL